MEDENSDVEQENSTKSATVQCVQYLISQHMKCKSLIRRDDLAKTVFKSRKLGKNYDRVMEDVANTLKNVFGLTLTYTKDDNKQFMIVNSIEEINIPGISINSSESSKYRILLKPIIVGLVMLRQPISEGQMWNILEPFSLAWDLDMSRIKTVVKKDFVTEQYLQYKPTDDTTVMMDPDKTSHWFSLGPRSVVECDQMMALQSVAKLYKKPAKSFVRVHAAVNNL